MQITDVTIVVALIGAMVAVFTTVSTVVIVILNNKQALRMEELKMKVEAYHKDVNGNMTKLLEAKDALSIAKQQEARATGEAKGAKDNQEKTDAKNQWAVEPNTEI